MDGGCCGASCSVVDLDEFLIAGELESTENITTFKNSLEIGAEGKEVEKGAGLGDGL